MAWSWTTKTGCATYISGGSCHVRKTFLTLGGYYFPFEHPDGPGLRCEYPAWGSIYYREPCLKATFADGVRDTRLVYSEHRIEGGEVPELVVVMRDPHYPLRVELHYRLFEKQDLGGAVRGFGERRDGANHAGGSALRPCGTSREGYGYRLTHLAGQFAGETQVYQEGVSPGKKTFESRRGITSHHANPFFALDWGDATNNTGEVWFGALGWSGNWKITVPTTTPTATCKSPAA